MKKLILATAVFGFFAVSAFTTGCDIPATIKAKFSSLYPAVKNVKWEEENGKYEAEFQVNKVETSCVFDAIGNLMETKNNFSHALFHKQPSAKPKGCFH